MSWGTERPASHPGLPGRPGLCPLGAAVLERPTLRALRVLAGPFSHPAGLLLKRSQWRACCKPAGPEGRGPVPLDGGVCCHLWPQQTPTGLPQISSSLFQEEGGRLQMHTAGVWGRLAPCSSRAMSFPAAPGGAAVGTPSRPWFPGPASRPGAKLSVRPPGPSEVLVGRAEAESSSCVLHTQRRLWRSFLLASRAVLVNHQSPETGMFPLLP